MRRIAADQWPSLLRKYLVFRNEEDFGAVLMTAPTGVATFLEACRNMQQREMDAQIRPLFNSLRDVDNEAAQSVRLAFLDVPARLITSYETLPPTAQARLLAIALGASNQALGVSAALADLPCEAFYTDLTADGLRYQLAFQASARLYERAISLYRELASSQPDAYTPRMAMCLLNSGTCLHQLGEIDGALRACRDAMTLYRGLSGSQRDLYAPSIAMALNNLGVLYRELRELEEARTAYEEAAILLRVLARQAPRVFNERLAKCLYNLGIVEGDLQDLHAAGRLYQEALAIYDALSEPQKLLCRFDRASTLNNCALIHNQQGEWVAARQLFEQAIAIYRQLTATERATCSSEIALTLSNLANLLYERRELIPAQETYKQALVIYRWLAQSNSSAYNPHVASTLTYLGNVSRDLKALNLAGLAYDEALAIYRDLAARDGDTYMRYVAGALTNLGVLFGEIRELLRAARVEEEALSIYQHLSDLSPDIYRADVGRTLKNLSKRLMALQDLPGAKQRCEEALALYRILAAEQPEVYRHDLAMTLGNLSGVLERIGELGSARVSAIEALEIYRELSQVEPRIYLPFYAATLNNLSAVYTSAGQFEEANQASQEAASIYKELQMWIEASVPLRNLGVIAESTLNVDVACDYFEQAVACLEKGLGQLSDFESDNRDTWKGRIESVYEWLIGYYAASESETRRRLVPRLCEALRQIELLAGMGDPVVTDGDTRGDVWEQIEDCSGPEAQRLVELGAAFLWIHDSGKSVVYVVLRPSERLRVIIGDKTWLGYMRDTMKYIEGMLSGSIQWKELARTGRFKDSEHDRIIRALGRQAFEAMPQELQDLFCAPSLARIIISPCSHTMSVPLELLITPSGRYLGVEKLLVRTHSLAETCSFMWRQPQTNVAVVVGEPDHSNSARLAYALAATKAIEGALSADAWRVTPAYGGEATLEWVFRELSVAGVGLFVFGGHGDAGELALSGAETLSWRHVARFRWTGNPFVHIDCCRAGADWARGGGRFEGMPAAMLSAGASAVLASFSPIYDRPAAGFSKQLYDSMLRSTGRLNVGDALMAARRAIHSRYGGNPLFWATSQIWGNPEVMLQGRPT